MDSWGGGTTGRTWIKTCLSASVALLVIKSDPTVTRLVEVNWSVTYRFISELFPTCVPDAGGREVSSSPGSRGQAPALTDPIDYRSVS